MEVRQTFDNLSVPNTHKQIDRSLLGFQCTPNRNTPVWLDIADVHKRRKFDLLDSCLLVAKFVNESTNNVFEYLFAVACTTKENIETLRVCLIFRMTATAITSSNVIMDVEHVQVWAQ
jgi:predicted SAM-dependent methyltransferase